MAACFSALLSQIEQLTLSNYAIFLQNLIIYYFIFLIKGEDVNFLGQTSLLTTTIWHLIDFLTNRQTISQKRAPFTRTEDLPGVFGAVDGTHVHIIAPAVNKETYQ